MDASLMQTSSQVSASAMSASQEQQQQQQLRRGGGGGRGEEDAGVEEKNLATANSSKNNNNSSENSTSEEEEMVKKTSPEANATATRRRRNKSMFRDISRRQWDPRYHKQCTQTQCMKHPSIIKGMRLLKNLEKHGGCVNTVSWNEDASLLISGSDDMTVVVWGTGTNFPVKGSVFTGHTHNVFDAQFVPNCNSTKCVTTAADGQVRMIDLERGFAEKPPNHHTNRYMRNINLDSPAAQQLWSGDGAGMGMKLIFLPGSATSFLSTHQDGCVRLFDIREGTRSRREVVIDLASVGAASDIAFDPTAPHTFAVGCDDPIVRVFDIRHHVAKLTRTSEDYYSHAGSPGTSPVPSPTGIGAMRRGGFYYGGSPSSTVGSPGTPTGVGGGGGGGYSSSPGVASGLPSSFGLPSSPPSRSSGFVERCLPTVAEYCPGLAFGAMKKFQGEEELMRSSFRSRRFEGISGIAFSKTGELACTYKGEDVYVLETRKVVSSVKIDLFKHDSMDELEKRYEGCAKKYEGRKNTRTFLKGVAFMCGDEYVTTGGDCGNIFVWNKKTTELVCKLPGDSQVVNNVIPHPHLPVLAASGIDSDIKIFEASKDGEHIEEPPRKGERDNDFDSSDEDDEDDEEIDGEEYVQINTPGGHVIQIPGRSLIELLRRRQEGRDGGIDPLLLEEEEGSDEDEDEDEEEEEDNSNDSDDSDDSVDDDDDESSSSSSSSSSSLEEEGSEYEDTGSGRREDELDGDDEELAMSEADEEDEQMEDAQDSFEENNVEQQQR